MFHQVSFLTTLRGKWILYFADPSYRWKNGILMLELGQNQFPGDSKSADSISHATSWFYVCTHARMQPKWFTGERCSQPSLTRVQSRDPHGGRRTDFSELSYEPYTHAAECASSLPCAHSCSLSYTSTVSVTVKTLDGFRSLAEDFQSYTNRHAIILSGPDNTE